MNIKDKRETILETEANKVNTNSYLQMGIGGCSKTYGTILNNLDKKMLLMSFENSAVNHLKTLA